MTNQSSKRKNDGDEASPSKRYKADGGSEARPDPTPPTPLNSPMRDPKYYFQDGDIHVVVEETMFRVHIHKLKSLGGKIATLLNVLQPTGTDELPELTLLDMVAGDARHLMAYAYGDLILNQLTSDYITGKVPWKAAVVLLKVSDIYDLRDLRRQVVATLKFLLPCGRTYSPHSSAITGVSKDDQTLFMRVLPLEAIKLCRQYNLPALLPMAFYLAAQLPITDIVNGILLRDNNMEYISLSDVVTVLVGRDRLKMANRIRRLRHFNEFKAEDWTNTCQGKHKQRGSCTDYLSRVVQEFNRTGFMDSRTDVLDPMHHMTRKIGPHLCAKCASDLTLALESGVAAVWEGLPEYFNLGSWEAVMEVQSKMDDL